MPTAFPFHILQEHEPKPEYGKPCNNCGLCCRVQACHVSEIYLHSSQAPCIALEVEDGKFYCGMMRRPSHYLDVTHLGKDADEILRPMIAKVLDIGAGCGMPDEVIAVKL